MGRPRNEVPSYRGHKKSGQAIVTLTNQTGVRRDYLLGRFGSKASKSEYARLLQEWETAAHELPPKAREGDRPADLTVNELLAAYWKWATARYVKDGKPTSEQAVIRVIMRPMKALYGTTLARDFGPLALKAVRKAMIDHKIVRKVKQADPETGALHIVEKMLAQGMSRGNINKLVGRIKSLYKWAVANELVPPATFQALACVTGLRKGEARETKPIRPVPDGVIEMTLPYLPAVIKDMVKLQRLTGARPGEILQLRLVDLDRNRDVWEFRPGRHKTEHQNRERIIFIGPQGQAIIAKYLGLDLTAPLFSPAASEECRNLERRAKRQTPLTPSAKQRRTRQKPQGCAGMHYSVAAYRRAIARACEQAGVPVWTPHRLRHSAATEIRRLYGLEASASVLGHAELGVTQLYAEKDMERARRVMAEIG
jgi:integrase